MSRAARRNEVSKHRRRARWIARTIGCTCPAELVVSPVTGAPVWARRPDTGKLIYLTRHAEHCPLWGFKNIYDWFVVDEPGQCER